MAPIHGVNWELKTFPIIVEMTDRYNLSLIIILKRNSHYSQTRDMIKILSFSSVIQFSSIILANTVKHEK